MGNSVRYDEINGLDVEESTIQEALEALRRDEKEVSDKCIEYEIESKNLSGERKRIDSELEKITKSLDGILRKISKMRKAKEGLLAERAELTRRIKEANAGASSAKELLEEIRTQILECTTVTVYVFSECIEAENWKFKYWEHVEIDDKADVLKSDNVSKKLESPQIKVIAKLLLEMERIVESGNRCNLVFDSEIPEGMYELVRHYLQKKQASKP